MTHCSELADIEWLTGDAAGALLAELAEDSGPLHTSVTRLRTALSPAQTHLLLEQVELRRRAAAKFAQPQKMFFTRLGLEQATDEWVARYKAKRFHGRGPAADLCCGIGGDLRALAEVGSPVGVDSDPVVAHFAAINSGTSVQTGDVGGFDLSGSYVWHIDPDRRPGGRRTTSLDWCRPDRATIDRFIAKVPEAAVKLAPAAKTPPEWAEHCEMEWISRGRECKQLVSWFGGLAVARGKRRATILTLSEQQIRHGLPPRTIFGQPNQPAPIAACVGDFVFDVDPAVVAARLTGALAAELKLAALGAGPTYLTGPDRMRDDAITCCEVEEVFPLRVRVLAQAMRARNVGRLEIKKRGVDIDPETLRRELKLRGDNAATLLITNIAQRPTAILARRD